MMVARRVTPEEFDQEPPADADRAGHLEYQAKQAQRRLAEVRAVAGPEEPRTDGGTEENDPDEDLAELYVGDHVQDVEEDHVIEVVFPQRTDVFLDEKQEYAYPRSRLERVAAVHNVDEENGGDA